MVRIGQWTVGVLGLALAALLVASAQADTKVKLAQEWRGSVADRNKEKETPKAGFILDQKSFDELWRSWNVGKAVPTIDFNKNIVLVVIGHGSKVSVVPSLDDKGNLKWIIVGTRGDNPGFRYHMAVVNKEGVKAINGVALPASARVEKVVPVKVVKEWGGSVDDRKKEKEAPKSGFLTDQATFDTLWRSWNVSPTVPTIDFSKNLALVGTSHGSKVNVVATLDSRGNLGEVVVGTTDEKPGFRFNIKVVSREGVKTVNGVALPK
jgi:hypothetical protein